MESQLSPKHWLIAKEGVMRIVKKLSLFILSVIGGLLAAPGTARADCEECRQQPWGRCAGKFNCIMSLRNFDCSIEIYPCDDACVEYGSGTGCPL
jgi:hypothetical protein